MGNKMVQWTWIKSCKKKDNNRKMGKNWGVKSVIRPKSNRSGYPLEKKTREKTFNSNEGELGTEDENDETLIIPSALDNTV